MVHRNRLFSQLETSIYGWNFPWLCQITRWYISKARWVDQPIPAFRSYPQDIPMNSPKKQGLPFYCQYIPIYSIYIYIYIYRYIYRYISMYVYIYSIYIYIYILVKSPCQLGAPFFPGRCSSTSSVVRRRCWRSSVGCALAPAASYGAVLGWSWTKVMGKPW